MDKVYELEKKNMLKQYSKATNTIVKNNQRIEDLEQKL